MYCAQAKANNHMTLDMVCDMIVDETSLSRGDVMNTLITLGRLSCRALRLGFSIDLGDLGSLRVYFPSRMADDKRDVTAGILKTPKIIFTPKAKMRAAAKAADVTVDNPDNRKPKTPKP